MDPGNDVGRGKVTTRIFMTPLRIYDFAQTAYSAVLRFEYFEGQEV